MSEIKPWRENIGKPEAYMIMCDVLDVLCEKEAIKKAVYERLKQAPSTYEWIPCSERLPEYRKLVDVTTRDLRVKLAYIDSIEEDGTDDLWIIPLEDAECALWNVVAWKPRPKPWKGDK